MIILKQMFEWLKNGSKISVVIIDQNMKNIVSINSSRTAWATKILMGFFFFFFWVFKQLALR